MTLEELKVMTKELQLDTTTAHALIRAYNGDQYSGTPKCVTDEFRLVQTVSELRAFVESSWKQIFQFGHKSLEKFVRATDLYLEEKRKRTANFSRDTVWDDFKAVGTTVSGGGTIYEFRYQDDPENLISEGLFPSFIKAFHSESYETISNAIPEYAGELVLMKKPEYNIAGGAQLKIKLNRGNFTELFRFSDPNDLAKKIIQYAEEFDLLSYVKYCIENEAHESNLNLAVHYGADLENKLKSIKNALTGAISGTSRRKIHSLSITVIVNDNGKTVVEMTGQFGDGPDETVCHRLGIGEDLSEEEIQRLLDKRKDLVA